ncbi:MAG: DEAD/DEAH box helicase, partial [Oscillospiraceae bacterium]|nr:DEAD/DEAH box helicase [Oscillospiraceae bacterium]
MKRLLDFLNQIPEFEQLAAALDSGRSPVALSGSSTVHRAYFAAGLRARMGTPVVLLCADEAEGEKLRADLRALTGEEAWLLPSREFTFHNAAVVSREWEHKRLRTLWALTKGEVPFLVVPAEALLQRTMPRELLEKSGKTLHPGEQYDLNELAELLTAGGYSRCDQVEGVGQFALRGGILDVFSPAHALPVRLEFFGDDVDSMGLFDPSTQRRTENLEEAIILPAAEVLPQAAPGGLPGLAKALDQRLSAAVKKGENDQLLVTLAQDKEKLENGLTFPAVDRYLGLIYPKMATALDYLPEDAVVLISESPRFLERCKNYLWQLGEDVTALSEGGVMLPELGRLCATPEELTGALENWPVGYLDAFTSSQYPQRPRALVTMSAKLLPSYGVSLETAVSDLSHYISAGFSTVVLVGTEQRCLNLQTLLREQKVRTAVDFQLHALPQPGQAVICCGGLSAGMEFPGAKVAVLTEGQAVPVKKRRAKAPTNREKLKSYADLTPGDLVVHQAYGIGRYQGMVKMPVDGIEKDYVKIAYAGADVLYVPATQLDQVSKYIGGGEDANETKKLSRLGGGDWERQKSRAKKAVQDLAKGLIQLYAQRQRQPGFAFSPDSPWQKEFEEEFEYTETEDQLRCIAEIKRDMEANKPMDRLLCGDVGYGKTEVAFRAIMKCVLDGKQAAILAPTTVLARQHYQTAKQRFA